MMSVPEDEENTLIFHLALLPFAYLVIKKHKRAVTGITNSFVSLYNGYFLYEGTIRYLEDQILNGKVTCFWF